MAKGISLHIGLNHVDPAHYAGWDGALNACVADAKDMLTLAKKQKFGSSRMLTDGAATAKAVTDAIAAAARSLRKGDLFLLTYSGHGGQVRDTNGDERDNDRMDETWVLFDRELVDDELYTLWRRFKTGVRVVVLSDSCHSGTVTREGRPADGGRPRLMPWAVAERVERVHAALYRRIQKVNPASEATRPVASVLLISGCMDNQLSQDGDRNGAFTGALKRVWARGAFTGDYRKLRDRIVALMPATQTPNYYWVGAPDQAFERQKPFTI